MDVQRDAKTPLWSQGVEHRLREVVEMLRETSRAGDDPQASVAAYAKRVRRWTDSDRVISISRRGLEKPHVRVTRSTTWKESIDPWKNFDRLPLFSSGFLSEVIHAGDPLVLNDASFSVRDPAYEYLEGMRSALVLPTWDNGEALNMVVQLAERPNAFDADRLPEQLWISNLFGRATKNLALSRDVKEAYAALDRELRSVADMQMSLLPSETPAIPTMELATHYQTSTRAGGDYYDFFQLPDDRWGILVADVSGHGTPAAVLMAIVHAIAHLMPGEPWPPHRALAYVNRALTKRYTKDGGAFVTMIYGVYDARTRVFHFANAGHPEPMVRAADGKTRTIPHPGAGLPLGIMDDTAYTTQDLTLKPGEALVLYTDGITEAYNSEKELFGEARLMDAISRGGSRPEGGAGGILAAIVEGVGAHAGLAHRSDDRTVVVGLVK